MLYVCCHYPVSLLASVAVPSTRAAALILWCGLRRGYGVLRQCGMADGATMSAQPAQLKRLLVGGGAAYRCGDHR